MRVYRKAGGERGLSDGPDASLRRGVQAGAAADPQGRVRPRHETGSAGGNLRQNRSSAAQGRVQVGKEKRMQAS